MDKNKLEALKAVHETQGSDGNWNYDEYMFGMYNGMELMLSIVEEREPVFKKRPKQFIEERIEKDIQEKSIKGVIPKVN